MSVPFHSVREISEKRLAKHRACSHRRYWLTLAFLLFLALSAGFLTRLAAIGLPQPWVNRLCKAFSSDTLSIELERVTFSAATFRLRAGSARVYPKGILSDPIAEATGISVQLRPSFRKPSADWIRNVSIGSLVVTYPEQEILSPSVPEDAETQTALRDFPALPFSCQRADVFGLRFHNAQGTLLCKDGSLELSDVAFRLDAPRESAQQVRGSASFNLSAMAWQANAKGTLDPQKICPLLESLDLPGICQEINRFDFSHSAPYVRIQYQYNPLENLRSLSIRLNGKNASYSGVPLVALNGHILVGGSNAWNTVTIAPLHIERPEGSADAALTIETDNRRIRFQTKSTIDPSHVFHLVRLLDSNQSLPLSFDNPTLVEASGLYAWGPVFRPDRIHLHGWQDTDLTVSFLSPSLTLQKPRPLRFERLRGSIRLKGNLLTTSTVDADVLDGSTSGSAELTLPFGEDDNGQTRLKLNLSGRAVSYPKLLDFFQKTDHGNKGRLFFDFNSEGPLDDLASGELAQTTGSYKIHISNGHVFRLPLFAGLTDVIVKYIPGVNVLVDLNSLDVHGEFRNRRVNLDDLSISGAGFGLTGKGAIWTNNDLEIFVKLHLLNKKTFLGSALYYIQWPVSAIFGLKATGQLPDPQWGSATLNLFSTSRRSREEAAE